MPDRPDYPRRVRVPDGAAGIDSGEEDRDMATLSWSKGRNGDWLVRGPVGLDGRCVQVPKRDGSTSAATLMSPVWQGDGVALYAVAKTGGSTSGRTANYDPDRFNGYGRPRGGYSRACKSGGNCSSIGSGRSCGGHDCDGY